MDNLDKLGYNMSISSGCTIYPFLTGKSTDTDFANNLHENLESYDMYLEEYNNSTQEFKPVPDLMKSIFFENDINTINHDVCDTLRIHPEGLRAIFPKSKESKELLQKPHDREHPFLSYTSKSGFVEPLLPPMRSHKICKPNNINAKLMSLDYLVHDFEHMCRSLKPTSRKIFIDMGAALDFHQKSTVPVVELLNLYEKFGFIFDHIYGFEMKFKEPSDVFQKQLPEKFLSSYHWINVGITHEEGHRLNPLHSILSKFTEEDFVVIKLDIDTSFIEVPLARQLLENPAYHHLIDQFYFEHHVNLAELEPYWRSSMNGTVKESLELFHGIREKGIPSHYWP